MGSLHFHPFHMLSSTVQKQHNAHFLVHHPSCKSFVWIIIFFFNFFFLHTNTPLVFWHAYLFCLYTVLCLFKEERSLHFLKSREASRIAVESVWPVSYVVSRVTVFLTAQYFKARFVWKCLHSTCTAVGLAVVAFIRLSVNSFGALICCSTCSLLLISACRSF